MKKNNASMWFKLIFIVVIVLLIDWYFFHGIRTAFEDVAQSTRNFIYYIYWGFTVFSIVFAVSFIFLPSAGSFKFVKLYGISLIIIVMVCKLAGIIPLLIDDVIRLFRLVIQFFYTPDLISENNGISRLKFLSYLAIFTAAIPFCTFVFGMIKGAFSYRLRTVKINLPNLPVNFVGLKIVQISDIHIGSFVSAAPLQTAIDIINEQKADIIFFTGDFVNNLADEAEEFIDILKNIQAPLGVFSILGNHDYGHYTKWDSKEDQIRNFERLKDIHREVGWRLLLNESYVLEKDRDKLAIVGVENWSDKMHFSKYGDLQKAISGTEDVPVKLLLSHDPSLWNAEVTKSFKDIDITFSGHTHGMQFGVEIPGFKWSPVQYVYKQWAGLYREGDQYLYVNRGLGFIGYMGRVGILPEITVIDLY
ncbi:MAG: metallophosphoesterase [Bacteroidota bacterium]